MKLFWRMAGFELRKILKRRASVIALLAVLGLNIFSCFGTLLGNYYVDGEKMGSHYQMMKEEREASKSIQGRTVDDGLLKEVSTLLVETAVDQKSDEFWHANYLYMELVPLTGPLSGNEMFQEGQNYYAEREAAVQERVDSMKMSENAKQKMLDLEQQVKQPFTFSYSQGFGRILVLAFSAGVFVCFSTAICVAPMFSGEYSAGMDQLILSSKHGKRRLIHAKIFTGMCLGAVNMVIQMLVVTVLCLIVYGPEGFSAPYQLLDAMSVYPLTMGQVLILVGCCMLAASLFFTAIILLFSALLKTPFTVIIVALVLDFLPMFSIGVNPPLSLAVNLLPGKMCDTEVILSPLPYQFGGLILLPWQMILLTAALFCVILLPLAHRRFRTHQIS